MGPDGEVCIPRWSVGTSKAYPENLPLQSTGGESFSPSPLRVGVVTPMPGRGEGGFRIGPLSWSLGTRESDNVELSGSRRTLSWPLF